MNGSNFGETGGFSTLKDRKSAGHVPLVMIADDDPGIVHALSRCCKRLGVDVATANNGLQAILKAKQNFPDVLIVDINMPELDGFSVCSWVLDPDKPPMEVIVITGKGDDEILERCESIGAYLVPKTAETWSAVTSILCEILDIEEPATVSKLGTKVSAQREVSMPTNGTRILVVDDDPDVVLALEARLRKIGATVSVAYNGLDAYRLAVREQPHLVIADYLMPEAGGHFLIWRLRDNPVTANTPIFVVSGQIETRDRPLPRVEDVVGPRGANRVFRKPVQFEELLEAVRKECPMLRRATQTA